MTNQPMKARDGKEISNLMGGSCIAMDYHFACEHILEELRLSREVVEAAYGIHDFIKAEDIKGEGVYEVFNEMTLKLDKALSALNEWKGEKCA